MSDDPTHPDYIEDYDFFSVKRKERLVAIHEAKRKIDAHQRIEIKKKQLKWRDNGNSAMQAVKSGVSGLRFLLEPHSNTKKTVAHFNSQVEFLGRKIQGFLCCRHCYPLSAKVLHVSRANPHLKHRWFTSKANLIEWKSNVMHEIRMTFRDKHPLEYEFRPRCGDVRLMRQLFRVQMDLIPIDRVISEELKKKRALYKVVTTKLKLIRDTMIACEMISHCKSRQHLNPKGCSNCGVRYIGGMLDGGTPYVQSISRDTGIPTLVTLEFEMETLRHEDIVQTEIVENVEIDLFAYEEVVLGIVRVNIQAWWCFVLVWKRYKRRQKRLLKSRTLHCRRRLVMMKREIDRAIKEAPPLDYVRYSDAYCDILPAFREYADLQTRLKAERILKWSKCFQVKLHVKVEETRDRKHKEYLRLLALPKPPRPIVMKSLPPTDDSPLICYRLECKMRKFLTKERYDIHMNMHYKSDSVRYQKYDADRAAREVREAREKQVLLRITDSRMRLQRSDLSDYSTGTSLRGSPLHRQSKESDDSSDVSTLHAQNLDGGEAGEEESVACSEDQASETNREERPDLDNTSQELSQLSLTSDLLLLDESTSIHSAHPSPHLANTALTTLTSSGERSGNTTSFNKEAETVSAVVKKTGFAERKGIPSSEYASISSSPSKSPSKHANALISASKRAGGSKTASQDSDMNYQSAQNVQQWSSMTHIYALHSMLNDTMFSLELVSKQGDISVAQRIPLDRPLIRIGTHSSCECVVTTSGNSKRDNKVAKIHCLLYCPTHKGSSLGASFAQEEEIYGGTAKAAGEGSAQLTLVDNATTYGTYVVSALGTRKAPVKITAGMVLTPGVLICIGVCKNGPAEISATVANQACVVYRVRCLEQELS